MKELIICRGIPASGKSTWAKEYLKINKNAIRINNDDMQLSLWNETFRKSSTASRQLKDIREWLIEYHMRESADIVIDNTNLPEDLVEHYRDKVTNFNRTTGGKEMYKVTIKDFRHVPLATCLQRNKERANPVPDEVIRRMYNTMVKPVIAKPEQDKSLPKAIVVDIDGTIAEFSDRSPYDHTRYYEDAVLADVVEIVKTLHKEGSQLIFLTGRDEAGRVVTDKWLQEKAGFAKGTYTLLMRAVGDHRKAAVFKEDAYIQHILGKYYVLAWFEDHLGNVAMARNSLGLQGVFQVGDGDY